MRPCFVRDVPWVILYLTPEECHRLGSVSNEFEDAVVHVTKAISTDVSMGVSAVAVRCKSSPDYPMGRWPPLPKRYILMEIPYAPPEFEGCSCSGASCDSSCPCYAWGSISDQFECHSGCSCGSECPHRVSQARLSHRIELRDCGAKGWGAFALEPISKGTFICRYAGAISKVSSGSAYELAMHQFYTNHELHETWYIDAEKQGNVSRWFNHSCEPNLELCCVFAGSTRPAAAIFSLRGICVGEELTFSYAKGCARADMVSSAGPCHCRSASCARFLPSVPVSANEAE
jgi:hypothetical protein